jgi:KDO2-lipid IV(A) lauroyltransferase
MHILAVLPHRLVVAFSRGSAWLMWRSNGRIRKVTECNLAICFPEMSDTERLQLARDSLYELNQCIFELGRTWMWKPERLDAQVTRVVGMDIWRAAVAEGKGIVVLAPHLGNWELTGIYLGRDHALTILYREPTRKVIGDIIRRARERRGAKLVSGGSSGVRTLLKALKSGGVLAILPDQVPPIASGKFAPFFGESALTMTLVTNLIQRTGAKAVCCYCKRLPGGKYELVFREVDEDLYAADVDTALAGLNKSVERCVRDCPEQYQWQYKRFKFLPNLEKRDYGDSKCASGEGPRHRKV